MRKLICCGLAASMLVLTGGCDNQSTYRTPSNSDASAQKVPNIKVTVVEEEGSKAPSNLAPAEQAPGSDSCNEDSDCTIIPTGDGCIPCADNAGQDAVSKSYARQVMGPRKDECLPKIQELQKGGQQPQRSQAQECQYNGAKCVQGQCQLATLTQDELKNLHGGQGGPQQGQGQGQRPDFRGRSDNDIPSDGFPGSGGPFRRNQPGQDGYNPNQGFNQGGYGSPY